jgi:DNA-binding transcriptional LysR family regulator
MRIDPAELAAFLAVAKAGGFRDAARQSGASPSGLSETVRRLEDRLGVRLLNRTTRSVTPTEAGARLIERLTPAFAEIEAAVDVVNGYRARPAGTLKLNVPEVVARLVLKSILPDFLAAYPEIRVEVVVDDGFVDIVAAGCDAGVRYGERLERDMIAVPIGPRTQRFATAAAPAYLDRRGRPAHPRELVDHTCLRARFRSGALSPWEFERDGEEVRVDPTGSLVVQAGAGSDLTLAAGLAGLGIVHMFEGWIRPHLDSGALEPVLEDWWQRFPGPFLYYPSRRLVPAPLRAFVDFVKA